MNKKIKIPFSAIKYILYQRTNIITHENWLSYNILKELNILPNYHKWILIESLINSNRIKNNYHDILIEEFTSIKDLLPNNATNILDIGAGLGGIDIFISEYYKHSLNVYLFDKTILNKGISYNYNTRSPFYSSLLLAKNILRNNGLSSDRIFTKEISKNESINLMVNFDIIISLLSWGFHYPVDVYIDEVYNLLINGGILILDIRKDTDGMKILMNTFNNSPTIIKNSERYQRVAIIK